MVVLLTASIALVAAVSTLASSTFWYSQFISFNFLTAFLIATVSITLYHTTLPLVGWPSISMYNSGSGKVQLVTNDRSFDKPTASSLSMVFSKGRGKKNMVPFIALVELYIGTLAV